MPEAVMITMGKEGTACGIDGTPLTVRDVISMWNAWDAEDEKAEPEWIKFFKEKWNEVVAGKASAEWVKFFEDAGCNVKNPPKF